MKNKEYSVTWIEKTTMSVIIEAQSSEEALDKFRDGDFDKGEINEDDSWTDDTTIEVDIVDNEVEENE